MQRWARRQVVADFSGGQLSSDGGVLLLRELDRGLGLILGWCEGHGVDYVFGLARNARLLEELAPALVRAREQAVLVGGPTRVFTEFSYRTLETWSRARRVIGKAERLGDKDNPRFIVTSLPRRADELYEKVYCARGEMENRIKEEQGDLFGERLSSHGFAANQLRLWLSAFA